MLCLRKTGINTLYGIRVQRCGSHRVPHYRLPERTSDRHSDQQPCAVQWEVSTTIQRETKMFLGADNEETAELTVPMYDFGDWASRIKAYRKKNHITQQELAQLMGVKHFTLRSWEQKQTKPPYHVWRLHKHLFDDSIKLT